MYLVMVNKDNLPQDVILVTMDRNKAQAQFLDTCSTQLSNWDAYTQDDKDILLDQGYERFGANEAILLVDTDGFTSDNEIAAAICGFPPKKVNKITRWIASGEIGEVDTIEEVLETAGRMLDKSCSEELFGQVIFEAEDGKVYVLNCEGTIGKINPEYLADVENEDV